MSDAQLFQHAIQWVKKHGYHDIKANHESYEAPVQYRPANDGEPMIPDVTAVQSNRKSYFEIAVKSENMTTKISKWKLLSTLAQRKGGKLFLLAPKGHKAFAEKLVKQHQLSAEIIALKAQV